MSKKTCSTCGQDINRPCIITDKQRHNPANAEEAICCQLHDSVVDLWRFIHIADNNTRATTKRNQVSLLRILLIQLEAIKGP